MFIKMNFHRISYAFRQYTFFNQIIFAKFCIRLDKMHISLSIFHLSLSSHLSLFFLSLTQFNKVSYFEGTSNFHFLQIFIGNLNN